MPPYGARPARDPTESGHVSSFGGETIGSGEDNDERCRSVNLRTVGRHGLVDRFFVDTEANVENRFRCAFACE